MADKTFTRAGTSVLNGVKAYRFANDVNRERVLAKNGHTDIHMIELGAAMTKEQAIQFLNEREIFAEGNKVTAKAARGEAALHMAADGIRKRGAAKPKTKEAEDATVHTDDDGFVEPKEEWIQVAMARKAREFPGLSARQLYETVMLTVKHFGDTEPNF